MATFKYFTECGGQVVELTRVYHSGAVSVAACEFTGTCPTCGQKHKASRAIQRKSNPSLHECGARCLNATGHLCECSCGGKNHGAGSFGNPFRTAA